MALDLARQLGEVLGPAGEAVFLAGFWGAVFSSLLGVWQSVPYLFADFLALGRGGGRTAAGQDLAGTRAYRVYLASIAVVPLPLLWLSVERAQLSYAVLGSLFMPLLALTLLLMNNRAAWVGRRFVSGWAANLILAGTLVFFTWIAARTAMTNLARLIGG